MKRYFNLLLSFSVLIIGLAAFALVSGDLFGQEGDSASPPWLVTKESSSIVYFIYQSPNFIKRYNLRNDKWMTDIPLNDTPTAFAVDADGLYISFGRHTSRFNLDGTGEVHLHNTNTDAMDLFTINDFLYIYYSKSLMSVDKYSGMLIDSKEYWYVMKGISVAPTIGKLFARSAGVSPSDIVEVILYPDGTLGNQEDSPYHGDYPSASKTYVFPAEDRVADDAGIVFNTNNLIYNNSLAGSFDDLAFYGELPLVLRDGKLFAYSSTCLETGTFTPEEEPGKIYVHGEFVYAFVDYTTGLRVYKIHIDSFEKEEPGQPVDPYGLAYTPDEVFLDINNVVNILSRDYLSVFRWSIPHLRYLRTMPLVEAPSYMTYSKALDRLYLAYPSGKITKTDRMFDEMPLVNSPQSPLGLAAANEYLFVCDPSGAWVSHFTYSPAGALISQEDWNYYSKEYIWCEANNKMYFFRDNTSPNDLLWEDIHENGVIGKKMDSPYHSSAGIVHPIRVAPDGSVVVLGSGRIYDAITLVQLNTLSNNIDDAIWLNGTLFTMREYNNVTQLQRWTANYGVHSTCMVDGAPVRMLQFDNMMLVITDLKGIPTFSIFDEDFNKWH